MEICDTNSTIKSITGVNPAAQSHSSTVKAPKKIILKLIEKGYQLVTVGKLGECRGGLKSGSVYSRTKK